MVKRISHAHEPWYAVRLCGNNLLHDHADQNFEPLSISSGVIWTALNIDYPGHSFSHLGVFRGTIGFFHHRVS